MRHLTDEHEVRVSPRAAALQLARHPHGAAYVLRPHAQCQAIFRIVRPANDLRFIIKAGDGHYRAKHLALNDFVVVARAP